MRTDKRVTALILRNNSILLVHRKKQGREYWVIPGGGVEGEETTDEGLVREVKEETGFDLKGYKLISQYEKDNIEHYFYLCDVDGESEPILGGPESTKNSEENWYHLEWILKDNIKNLDIYPDKVKDIVDKLF